MQRNNFNWIFRSLVCLRCFFCLLLNCKCNGATFNWMCNATIYVFLSSRCENRSVDGYLNRKFIYSDEFTKDEYLGTVSSLDGEQLMTREIIFFCTSKILFRWITHSERRSQTQLNHHKINNNEQKKIWYRSRTFDGTESGRRVRVARFLSIEVITLHRTYQISLTVCSFGILVSVVRVLSVCAWLRHSRTSYKWYRSNYPA